MTENFTLSKSDYEEPACLLKMGSGGEHIPTVRVISKLDEYLDKKNYPAAERHLQYWQAEADLCGDSMGKLSVLNEQIGLYRKIGKKEECFKAAEAALQLADSLEIANTEIYGTTLVKRCLHPHKLTFSQDFVIMLQSQCFYRQGRCLVPKQL